MTEIFLIFHEFSRIFMNIRDFYGLYELMLFWLNIHGNKQVSKKISEY